MKEIRTIIWDLDETVWYFKENQAEILSEILKIGQKKKFKEEYYKMWNDLLLYFKDEVVTYNKVIRYIEKQIPTLKEYRIPATDFLRVLQEKKKELIIVNQEAIEMMKYFVNKGYTNISITDWFTAHQEVTLSSLNILNYVEKIYGFDNAYLKNSIYKVSQTVEELNLEQRREEFVIIGDSLTSDIFFAKQLGIKSIWYNAKGNINRSVNVPNIEVSSLLELKDAF